MTIDLQLVATALAAVLALPLGLAGYRMVKGPGYADRFVAFDMLTAVGIALAALTTVATGNGAFLDIGLCIALINFVATAALASFLKRKGRGA